jgi:hypothetical protein
MAKPSGWGNRAQALTQRSGSHIPTRLPRIKSGVATLPIKGRENHSRCRIRHSSRVSSQ